MTFEYDAEPFFQQIKYPNAEGTAERMIPVEFNLEFHKERVVILSGRINAPVNRKEVWMMPGLFHVVGVWSRQKQTAQI